MRTRWTDFEKDFIRGNAAALKDEDLAARLSLLRGTAVSLNAVRHARARLGLKKKHGRGRCELVSLLPTSSMSLRLTGA